MFETQTYGSVRIEVDLCLSSDSSISWRIATCIFTNYNPHPNLNLNLNSTLNWEKMWRLSQCL